MGPLSQKFTMNNYHAFTNMQSKSKSGNTFIFVSTFFNYSCVTHTLILPKGFI